MRGFLAIAALVLAGCSSAPEKKAETPPPPPPVVKDDRIKLLADHQTSATIVQDHLLGNKALPGGTLGEYTSGPLKYKLFIIETASAQDAAFLLTDMKPTLKDPEYIAYMGGYFGSDDNGPVYVFAKKQYLAGVVGLPRAKADPIARELAARLN
jgi:hypothetical protein